MNIWILVADSTRARIFEATSPISPFTEIDDLAHPEGRLHPHDLTSDKHGRTYDAGSSGSHGRDNPVDPKQQEAIAFARQIAECLECACSENKFERLVLVAAPAFLGLLRENLANTVVRLVTREVDKNIVQLKVDEIRKLLPERL